MTYNVFSGTLNPTHFTSLLQHNPVAHTQGDVETLYNGCIENWESNCERFFKIDIHLSKL